jgi:C4-dicarboxylate transporter, DctM subunit
VPGPVVAALLRTYHRSVLGLALCALAAMVLLPTLEVVLRRLGGRGIDNAALLVQHLGLVMSLFGALAAERAGHLTVLGGVLGVLAGDRGPALARSLGGALAGGVCGMLATASWQFVAAERGAGSVLAYGLPVWWVQAALPLAFALMGLQLAARASSNAWRRPLAALVLPLAGSLLAWGLADRMPGWAGWAAPALLLAVGAPVFVLLGALALALFGGEALPLASVPLSHYQITVNPSLPALPLFTLAGLVLACTGAAPRLGAVLVALFGGGSRATVLATALLCSLFTAFTGGSGVTILAVGGLLLGLLTQAGYPEQRGIGLVTSASALGVLLAPSVPLIMVAVIARVPIQQMFAAGVLPALVMVGCLLAVGGFLRQVPPVPGLAPGPAGAGGPPAPRPRLATALWAARWELMAPLVALGSLLGGWATPTEGAALTAAYAVLTQWRSLRALDWRLLRKSAGDCVMVIGNVMLILGMALALTNFLIDTGVPDSLVDAVRERIGNRHVFMLALCAFLFVAAAFMEIYAAIVVLVPLLLPLARSYGYDDVHFGIIFLAAMEVGFLCPPAGMNLYFASAMFNKPMRYVVASVLPALAAIATGTLVVAALPGLSSGVAAWLGG